MKRKVLTMLLAVTMSATVGSPVCAADFTSGTAMWSIYRQLKENRQILS